MRARQTDLPTQWSIVAGDWDAETRQALRRLPRGAGILSLGRPSLELGRYAKHQQLWMLTEAMGEAARVHTIRELRQALLRRVPLVLLSPLYRTATHPTWTPVPRMRAAALARLAGRRLYALGGMDAQRFRRIERLGFQGWAGISAFRT